MQHALSVLASTGALQTAVLEAIADRLADLHRLLTDPTATDRRIFSTLTDLENQLEALRANTKQFSGELQRLLRAEHADSATFREVKSSTVTTSRSSSPTSISARTPSRPGLPRSRSTRRDLARARARGRRPAALGNPGDR